MHSRAFVAYIFVAFYHCSIVHVVTDIFFNIIRQFDKWNAICKHCILNGFGNKTQIRFHFNGNAMLVLPMPYLYYLFFHDVPIHWLKWMESKEVLYNLQWNQNKCSGGITRLGKPKSRGKKPIQQVNRGFAHFTDCWMCSRTSLANQMNLKIQKCHSISFIQRFCAYACFGSRLSLLCSHFRFWFVFLDSDTVWSPLGNGVPHWTWEIVEMVSFQAFYSILR